MHVYKNISEEQKDCTRCCFTCFVSCEEKVSECTFPSFWEFRISCVWRHMSEGMRLPILIPIIKQIGPVWLGLKDDTIGTTLPFTLHSHTRYSHAFWLPPPPRVRPTSHMRLRARDCYTSSTLIGGKGGSGPSSLPTTLEGLREYVNARWM
jgi:hypothetical protein